MSIVRKKLVAVGDVATGKSCLFLVFTTSRFPEFLYPTVCDNYAAEVVVEQQRVDLQLFDTAGAQDYDRLRPSSYAGSDAVLIVFSVSTPETLESVESKWIEEVRHFLPNVPVILVGNQTDLRDSDSRVSAKKFVTTEMGMKMARKIKAHSYLECSALKNEGVQEVFEVAVKAAISNEAVQLTKKTQCCILL